MTLYHIQIKYTIHIFFEFPHFSDRMFIITPIKRIMLVLLLVTLNVKSEFDGRFWQGQRAFNKARKPFHHRKRRSPYPKRAGKV